MPFLAARNEERQHRRAKHDPYIKAKTVGIRAFFDNIDKFDNMRYWQRLNYILPNLVAQSVNDSLWHLYDKDLNPENLLLCGLCSISFGTLVHQGYEKHARIT